METLFRLSAADDITGIARGVAFQLTEALGVLDRQKVADDVKGLDQSARATLRKYGVRFGAYHIYLPALLKPAPRALATQLWALKHGGSETKGLEAIQQLAGSGRTSIAADAEFAKGLYRVAGYRVCGERAVRVDILERLADLIRPALAWRTGASSGAKPPGAIDGFGFTVTVGMTSLAGCSGEDFASVLRSLGYRLEKRPKPAEPPAAPAESATAASSPSVDAGPGEAGTAGEAPAPAGEREQTSATAVDTEATLPDVLPAEAADETLATAPAEAGEASAEPTPPAAVESVISVPEAPTLAVSEPAEAGAEIREASASQQSPDAVSDPKLAAEEFIEVWRPGRRDEHPRKPRHERGQRPRRPPRETPAPLPAAGSEGTAAISAEDTPVPAGGAEAAPADGHRQRPERTERPERQAGDRAERQRRPDRPGRPERERAQHGGGRPQRGDRPERAPRGDRPDRDPALRAKYIKGRGEGRDRRDREPDPNSPFAKLAALKEQLEANTKEPR